MTFFNRRVLEWDSNWFGFPVGQVDVSSLEAETAEGIDNWARKNGLRCVYLRSDKPPGHDVNGFEPMDVRVKYALDPMLIEEGGTFKTSPIHSDELKSVCEMARRLFTETRFFRDSRFPRDRVRELYAEWLIRDTTEGLPGTLVARIDCGVTGFVSGRKCLSNKAIGEIGLIGVEETHRGRGIGRDLLIGICCNFLEYDVKIVNVYTQESNSAACRLYEAMGGRVVSRSYWHHRWYDNVSF